MLERDLYSAGLTEASLVCAARKTGVKARRRGVFILQRYKGHELQSAP